MIMEKQKQNKISRPITAKEMYDLNERNYDWESFKYVLPKKYDHKSTSNLRPGSIFGQKKNYLDDLQSQKKKIPGPNHYIPSFLTARPKSGKMDKSQRKTISQEVNQKSMKQNIPGPGAYFKRPQSANIYTYRANKQKHLIERSHYLNEVQYLGITSPGVGSYNLSQNKHVGVPKLFKKANKKENIQEKEKEKEKDKENQKNQKLLNTAKSVKGSFQWMKNQAKKSDSKFFGKSQRFVTEQKSSKKLAPNSYKLNNNWLSKNNLANVTCTNIHKSVYYH